MKKNIPLHVKSIRNGILFLFLFALFFNSHAQPFSSSYLWSGTIGCPTSTGTLPSVTGLTFTQFTRGSINCISTTAALRSSNWPNGDSASAVSGNKYVTFSVSSNSSTSVVISSVVLKLLINSTNSGNGGPQNAKLKYTTSAAYNNFGAPIILTTSATNYTFTPTNPIILSPSQTITFRLYGYNSGNNGSGTMDVISCAVNGQTNLGQYRSKTSGNWNDVTLGASSWEISPDGSNWTEALVAPNNNSSIITIASPHIITVATSVSADEFTINSGGRITVNAGQTLTIVNGSGTDLTNNGILDIQGSVSGTGSSCIFGSGAQLYTNNATGVNGALSSFASLTFSASNNNSFTFNSSGNQVTGTLMPAFVQHLTIANGGTKTLSQKTTMSTTGVLTLTGGTFDLNNDSLILLSNASNTARVAAISGGGGFANASKFTMQRFITSGSGRFWWHMSSPVNGASVAQWQDDFLVTGTFSNPSSATGVNSAGPSIKYYDETVLGTNDLGYVNYPTSGNSSANPLVIGRGYRVFIRDNNVSSSNKLVDVSGTPNTGTQNFNVTLTGTDLTNGGWNFVGNPYPSDIDWSNAGWTKTNMDNAVYVWNAVTQSYASFINGSGTNGGTGRIASSQGFWVKANAANPTLIATENVKTSTAAVFTKNLTLENLLRIQLQNAIASDEIIVRFDPQASEGFDYNFDAYSMTATTLGLSSIVKDTIALSINSLPELSDDLVIQLNSYYAANGNFNLMFYGLESFTYDIDMYLYDKYLDSLTPVINGFVYDFGVTADASSKVKDRFDIRFSRSKITGVNSVKSKNGFLIYPNPTNESYFNIRFNENNGDELVVVLYDILGKEVLSQTVAGTSLTKIKLDDNLPKGIYMVQCTLGEQKYIKNLVIR